MIFEVHNGVAVRVLVISFGLVHKVLVANGPAFDLVVKLVLVNLDSLAVPNLQQELLVVVIVLDTGKGFYNHWHVLHALVVRASFVDSVKTVKLNVV